MDLSGQHLSDILVVACIVGIIGFLLGWLFGRGQRYRPDEARGREQSADLKEASDALLRPVPQTEKFQRPPQQSRPEPGRHSAAPARDSRDVPAPVVPESRSPKPPEPASTAVSALKIRTRTGENQTGQELLDPYAARERVWTEAETAQAMKLYRADKGIFGIAQTMQIDQKQVAIHLIRALFRFDGEIDDQSTAFRNGKTYTDEEISKLESYYEAGVPIGTIAGELDRTVLGVGWRMIERRMP